MRGNIMRLCYFTKNSKDQKANYGYHILNKDSIFVKDPKKSISLANKCCINTDKDRYFTFKLEMVKGAGLREFEI
jgi:hypothetical protein